MTLTGSEVDAAFEMSMRVPAVERIRNGEQVIEGSTSLAHGLQTV